MSKIEWTDVTWNPFTGCTKVSPGCDNCYMHAIVPTAQGDGREGLREGRGDRAGGEGTFSAPLPFARGKAKRSLCQFHE